MFSTTMCAKLDMMTKLRFLYCRLYLFTPRSRYDIICTNVLLICFTFRQRTVNQ